MNNSISGTITKRQDKSGMLRRALERIIQLYTDKAHFVYELLQNAEDAGATKIRFEQTEDQLVVQHDGHAFTIENLQGLCDIGKSDKINSLNQIGEFGVGFKSVFGICEIVRLYSHPRKDELAKGCLQFAIEIHDFTNPVDIEDGPVDEGFTTKFVFPYKAGLTFSGFSTIDELNKRLSSRLQNLGITTLLFMKNLQSISYRINLETLQSSGIYSLNKEKINDHCSLVTAVGTTESNKDEEEISYLLFSRPINGIQEGRTIDIAFAVNINKDKKFVFKKVPSPYISVYFPTETESKLNFIVQGPYRTTPNRSSVPADDRDNLILAEQTADLLHDTVLELRDKGLLDFTLLNLLPVDKSVFTNAPLFRCLYDTVKEMMSKEKILLCRDGTYAAADSVKIARGTEFADVFTDELLTQLIDDGNEYRWLPSFLTETNKEYDVLFKFLTSTQTGLGITVVRPENLRTAFNKNTAFLKRQSDEWLIRLYNMYASVSNAFSKGRNAGNMLTANFIKTSKGTFVAPFRKNDGSDYYSYGNDSGTYLNNVFLPSKSDMRMNEINYVDENILKACPHFFIDVLGLTKPDEYSLFIREFKRNHEIYAIIPDSIHFEEIKQLLKFREYSSYQSEIDELIRNSLSLRCIQDGEVVYINPSTDWVYFSVTSDGMSIEQYFKHIVNNPYVDLDYYEKGGIDYETLLSLDVTEDISLGMDTVRGDYKGEGYRRKTHWSTQGDFRWELTLQNIDHVLNYIEKNPTAPDSFMKSSFIFRFLKKNMNRLTGTVYVASGTQVLRDERSEILQKLNPGKKTSDARIRGWNNRWLYTSSNKLVSQKEITKRELNTHYYGELDPDSKIYELLGFKTDEIDAQEAAKRNYDQIDEETKTRYFEIECQRRFGISSEEVEQFISGEHPSPMHPTETAPEAPTEYDFPTSDIRSWELLRQHAAETLAYAHPKEYAYKIRRIRSSDRPNEAKSYLKGMYRVDYTDSYACQLCHNVVPSIERCEISNELEKELNPMNLCMCPNCAEQFRAMRRDKYMLDNFVRRIKELKDSDIESESTVTVTFKGHEIWFTQTHVAEIRELLNLKESIEDMTEDDEPHADPDPEPITQVSQPVQNLKFGSIISHVQFGKGTVKNVKDGYMYVQFPDGKYLKLNISNCERKYRFTVVKY